MNETDVVAVALPSLGADVSRCNGHIYANGKQECPQRSGCVRFLVPPVKDYPRQSWLFVAGEDQMGQCTEFWKA
jgi:hypothetical protein